MTRARVQRAVSLAESEGGLVEAQTAPRHLLPYAQPPSTSSSSTTCCHGFGGSAQCNAWRRPRACVRGGGRCVVIQAGRRGGIAGLFGGGSNMPATEVEALLNAAGFRAVHTLAEREGLLFVEGARRA